MEAVSLPDEETTFAELHARLALARAHLENADTAALDACQDKEIEMDANRFGTFLFKDGQTYVSEYLIPNFHFHMATGYCLLRAQGVDIGAFDYLSGVFVKKPEAAKKEGE